MATCPFVLYKIQNKIQNKIQKYESRFALRKGLHGTRGSRADGFGYSRGSQQ